jgi:lysophospholipase L1-like esterase
MKFKTFAILGDSISTFKGFIPPENEAFYPREGYDVTEPGQTWWKLLEKQTGLQLVFNDSYSGSRVSKTGSKPEWTSFLSEKRQARLGSDAILVFGGTNDYGQEYPASLDVFSEAYETLVTSLVEKYPQSDVFFCTPLRRLRSSLEEKNSQLWSQLDLAQTIRRCVASKDKARLIDLASYQIEDQDKILQDGLHPTCLGMELLCRLIRKGMEQS